MRNNRNAVVCGLCPMLSCLGGCNLLSMPEPTIEVMSPAEGSEFTAGSTIHLTFDIQNFELREPPADDAKRPPVAHEGESGTTHTTHAGHYHVYLDDATGDDPHVTAFTTELDYVLPADLSLGEHTLHIELEDDSHADVGVETDWSFQCVAG